MKARKRHKDQSMTLGFGPKSFPGKSRWTFNWRSPLSKFLFCAAMLSVFVILCIMQSLGAHENADAYSNFFQSYAKPLLIPRPPGSKNSAEVVNFLDNTLSSMGYLVHRQTFLDRDPTGVEYSFTNVWTETNPKLPKLVFACHHDSKVIPEGSPKGESNFVGAVDSSIPCAILLQLAELVSSASEDECKGVAAAKKKFSFVFLFFDGEEAFYHWTDTDSLYGSRYFVSHINKSHPGFVQNIKMFTLLDLLGARELSFRQTIESKTDECYRSLSNIETKLRETNPKEQSMQNRMCHNRFEYHWGHKRYFTSHKMSGVSDDHLPFQEEGVPILHLISVPFPKVWHTMEDTEASLHHPTIENILIILIQFIDTHLISCVNK